MSRDNRIGNASKRYTLLILFWMSSLFADEFPFKPPQNFTLQPKFIAVHHPVTTSQILAQLYFDQGLTLIYAFNHDAAYWSFLKAAEVDPNMTMAYWGMALALGSNINMDVTPQRANVAYKSIQKAMELAEKGAESEKKYIQSLAQRYSDNPDADQKELNLNYRKAMKELSQTYPDDLDAAVLYAESILDVSPWNQWSPDGKPQSETMEAVKTLQSVLKKSPQHLGANHYLIHAVEASLHPEIALMSAERLKTLLPSSGHILHMPSHIYLLVGDYRQAALSNEAAVAVDRAYMQEYGITGIYPLHYLSHNLYFLSRAYTILGRFEDAKRAAYELVDFYLPHFKKMPDLEYYASSPLTVLITFHRWKEILEMPQPSDELLMTRVLWHFGRALAFANWGDVSQALQEQRLFREGKDQIAQEQMFGYNKADKVLKIAEYCLAAKLVEVQGNPSQAVDLLQKAVAEQDFLRYNEPPDWFFPVRETLGGVLLRLQKNEDAERVFREELKRHPRNGRTLFGLKESLKAQSKTHDLYWVNEEFQQAWLYSDISLNIHSL